MTKKGWIETNGYDMNEELLLSEKGIKELRKSGDQNIEKSYSLL